MVTTTKKMSSDKLKSIAGIQRSYSEIVEYLDSRWSKSRASKGLAVSKALDKALGNPSKKTDAVFVGGTNGKGLTINFASTLMKYEGLSVGAFYSPHIMTYNEYFSVNGETISNKNFTELANTVINAAQNEKIDADTLELLTMMALVHFENSGVDIALLELHEGTAHDPFMICKPKIIVVTRITDNVVPSNKKNVTDIIKNMLKGVHEGTHVISADQSKANLQVMLEETKTHGGTWAMPIRKLAQLPYPFEQLHGRCAALAERIGQIYINEFANKSILENEKSLLAKQKGQRGRPTLEAKRQAELNPKKTIEHYWKDVSTTLSAHFQLLDKEKPSILLDNAANVDALQNMLLGIRLMHYQKPLKGLAFIFACDKNKMDSVEFLRQFRYFSKKNSGTAIFCPISRPIAGSFEESWDIEKITNEVKNLKLKARVAQNFEQAFEEAKNALGDERHGLVVIAGSQSVIAEYWQHKGMKKL